jgi:hypothetical protein
MTFHKQKYIERLLFSSRSHEIVRVDRRLHGEFCATELTKIADEILW